MADNKGITSMMKPVSTSETSDTIYQTSWRNIRKDSHFNTRRHENLKSHSILY
jgi:hypothetical protein